MSWTSALPAAIGCVLSYVGTGNTSLFASRECDGSSDPPEEEGPERRAPLAEPCIEPNAAQRKARREIVCGVERGERHAPYDRIGHHAENDLRGLDGLMNPHVDRVVEESVRGRLVMDLVAQDPVPEPLAVEPACEGHQALVGL